MRKITNEELGRKNVEEFRRAEKIPVIVVLDNVRSLHNVGSVFRTADAFVCECIFLTGITATPPHREIEKTALGATASVEWKFFQTPAEAIDALRSEGYKIIVVEQAYGGIALEKFPVSKEEKYALVFGHELNGVGEDFMNAADSAIEIQQYGTKHSLNISVCAGIVIHYFFSSIRK